MMKGLFTRWLPVTLGLFGSAVAGAQTTGTITGIVTSDAGAPLPAVTVSIASLRLGAYTDDAGRYTITVPTAQLTGQTVTLTARRIGYRPKSVQVTLASGLRTEINFTLETAPNQLTGIVVSALGLQKEKSQLGTSVQQLTGSELNTTHDANVLNQLEGKVSGVAITASGTQGGSTNIVIRGQNSITGNNQPLFIVDGVVMSNYDRGGTPNVGTLDNQAGVDYGSAIRDLNPDDIASISVLKGPNAAALYGSRAANGVVLITTKRGGSTSGKINTEITTSYTFDTPSRLPTYQNLYGQGAGGQFAFLDGSGGGTHDDLDQSYGPRFKGQLITQFNSPVNPDGTLQPIPWVARPNNVASFFNTGHTFDGTVAFSGGTDRASGRLSLGTEQTLGIIPNSSFRKFTGLLSGQFKVSSRLSATGTLNYMQNGAHNRPGVGYNSGILEQFIWFGRQVDVNALRDYKTRPNQTFACNGQYNWNCNFHNNPFWLQYQNPQQDSRDNIVGNVSATYKVTPWLDARLQSGSNIFRFNTEQDVAGGNLNYADANWNGGFSFFNNYSNENNTELLLIANKQATSRIALNALLGGNVRRQQYSSGQQFTTGILAPGVYNVANAAITPTIRNYNERRQVNSVYGSASFTLNNWWTVEGTARNDWSSTLPPGKNSYFYPSVNTSFVLTDAIPAVKGRVLSYAKLRGSIARVGNDAGPYQLATVYQGSSNKFGGQPLFTQADQLANANLLPEITKASEAGIELGFFNNRATIDASIYRKETSNQVISLRVSSASGYETRATNAGKIQNSGIDALVTIIPIDQGSGGLRWTSTFNYSANRSKLLELAPGLSTIVLGSSWGANIEARVGEPYGAIVGYTYKRDSVTKQLLLRNGLPQRGPRGVLGNIQPRWVGGWSNEFRYKRVALSGLFDFHIGGDVFSVSNMFGNYAGVFATSLRGREVDWNNPGLVLKGIDQATGQPNTTNVTSEVYFQDGLFALHEAWVYPDTWIKLRELRLAIDFPQSWANRLHASAVSAAFIGRNLWLVKSTVPNIDPEFAYSTSNFQGIEFAALPNPRSIGFNLRITP